MLRHDFLPVIQLLLDLIHLFLAIFQALSGDPNVAVVFLPESLLIQLPVISSPEISIKPLDASEGCGHVKGPPLEGRGCSGPITANVGERAQILPYGD
jgi:hypothetical protein